MEDEYYAWEVKSGRVERLLPRCRSRGGVTARSGGDARSPNKFGTPVTLPFVGGAKMTQFELNRKMESGSRVCESVT